MDWKYLTKLKPDELNDEVKDELLQSISWHDFSEDELDQEKTFTILKICKEIMKYKNEQVETLLSELDEIATKEGEEKAKKYESDFESKSSRVSSSIDIDDADNKFRELKIKYKKLQKSMDNLAAENKKLKDNIRLLEQERIHLQNELQRSHFEDNDSDISEIVKDQHKDLIDNLHQKNAQIKQLLTDIENVETNNLTLRQKTTNLEDELLERTENIKEVLEENEKLKIGNEDLKENVTSLQLEVESYKQQVEDISNEKQHREVEYEEFAKEVDKKIYQWKALLESKNQEIETLSTKNSSHHPPSSNRSVSESSSFCEDLTQISALNKIIMDRDSQILNLKRQLQDGTLEINDHIQELKEITSERDNYKKNCERLSTVIKDLKKQVAKTHSRCQELQSNIEYQEALVQMKNEELEKLGKIIKNEQEIDVDKVLKNIQDIKTANLKQEHKIEELVKTCNKLQNSSDNFQKENISLREILGLSEDDFVSTKGVSTVQKQQRKIIRDLKTNIDHLNNEILNYRFEIQKLKSINTELSDKMSELEHYPNILSEKKETISVEDKENSNALEFKSKNDDDEKTIRDAKDPKYLNDKLVVAADNNKVDVLSKVSKRDTVKVDEVDTGAEPKSISHAQYEAVVAENNALRLGLQEILESVQNKQKSSIKEIKSDTLESLLRALDVKHISGWYHPAMRLQAELHTVQGSNSELREQLRIAREELENVKVEKLALTPRDNQDLEDKTNGEAIMGINQHLLKILQNYEVQPGDKDEILQKLLYYKEEFSIIQQQIILLYNQYTEEKQQWEAEVSNSESKCKEVEERAEILQEQLKIFKPINGSDKEMIKNISEMAQRIVVLNRKCVYLESQDMALRKEINNLRNQVLSTEKSTLKKIQEVEEEKASLSKQCVEGVTFTHVKSIIQNKLEADYDNLLIKERGLMTTIEELHDINKDEIDFLHRKIELLSREKKEIEEKLFNSSNDCRHEVNEFKERQRADHMHNLYELVKDQLEKSGEKIKELKKSYNEIIHKNIVLQESLKDLENSCINKVDENIFKALENEYNHKLEENELVKKKLSSLQETHDVLKNEHSLLKLWSNIEHDEYFLMKHQIVDLQSVSDDAAVIAKLSSDVIMARSNEAATKIKLEAALEEINNIKGKEDDFNQIIAKQDKKFVEMQNGFENQIRYLEQIIRQQRKYYMGSVPFISHDKFVENIQEITAVKKKRYDNLQNVDNILSECTVLKEYFINETNSLDIEGKRKAILKMHEEKKDTHLQILRYKKQSEFKEYQLSEALSRINRQDEQLSQMQIELLQSLIIKGDPSDETPVRDLKKVTSTIVEIPPKENNVKQTNLLNMQTQTDNVDKTICDCAVNILRLEADLSKKDSKLDIQDRLLEDFKSAINELEKSNNFLKQQVGDRQSQVMFYEKHILEMQTKKEGQGAIVGDSHEFLSLKENLKILQSTIADKDATILNYQSLIKKDRDEHSLAAARLQEEIKQLQNLLKEQQNVNHPGRAAIEQYILQVHALEKHTSDLHTSVSNLNSQLQSSRQEAVRWKSLAYDRLQNMEELRISLEEQHSNELAAYKSDSEKWRKEVSSLQQYIEKYKIELINLKPDIEKELKLKNNKIHELSVTIRQLKNELKKPLNSQVNSAQVDVSLEGVKEQLLREQNVLKQRIEQCLSRERSAREEIRTLKGQLMKRPILSARSDNSITKEQRLQRKLTALETEVEDLKEKLQKEISLNESHKGKVNEDFEKWNKQKFWQQSAERLKVKLKERSDEAEKLQQTCSGYRMLIERLEREKFNFEQRMKKQKGNAGNLRQESLEMENRRLLEEIVALESKLEMQQHHSGALGATMLQEKLEGQERKIAILEMSAKGSSELRAELERLHSINANIQKSNLRLEAESLELRLDLEKSRKELPHLKEQIQHLENYIDVLKTENITQHTVTNSGDSVSNQPTDCKRIQELERTVLILRRIVEKLQVENKRLTSGGRPIIDRATSAEKVKRELGKLKEEHLKCEEKIILLEKQIEEHSKVNEELTSTKQQLRQKSDLLDKVKILLHKAAAKEKALLEQIKVLKPSSHLQFDENITDEKED